MTCNRWCIRTWATASGKRRGPRSWSRRKCRSSRARLQSLDVVPTIVSLQEHLETVRQAEIDRVRSRLGALSPEQEMAVEALTRGIINKIMHTPITTLKSAARESEATTVVELVRRIFNLRSRRQKRSADAAAATNNDEAG